MRVTPSNSKSNWSDVLNVFLFPYLFKLTIKRLCRTQTLWKIKHLAGSQGCENSLGDCTLHNFGRPRDWGVLGVPPFKETPIFRIGEFSHMVRMQFNEDSNQFQIILQGTNISHQTGRGKSSVQQWYVSAQEGRCFWPPFLGGWTHTKLPFWSFEIGQKNVWPIPRVLFTCHRWVWQAKTSIQNLHNSKEKPAESLLFSGLLYLTPGKYRRNEAVSVVYGLFFEHASWKFSTLLSFKSVTPLSACEKHSRPHAFRTNFVCTTIPW